MEEEWEGNAHPVEPKAEVGSSLGLEHFLAVKSKINEGGVHLRRLAPMKDLFVPSGPLASLGGTVFNLFNGTFGAGVLSYGIAYQQMGIVWATFFSVLVGCAQVAANDLMLRAAERTSTRSMSVLAFRTFGLFGAMCVDILVFLSGFGCLVAYFVLFGDIVLPVAAAFIAPGSLLATDRVIAMLFVGLLVTLPLSLRTSINSLHFFTFLSVLLFVLVVLGIVVFSAIGIVNNGGATGTLLGRLTVTSFQGMSIVVYGFANTAVILPVYIEMSNPSRQRIFVAQVLSGVLVVILYCVAGAVSYACYGSALKGNVLQNLPVTSVTILMQLFFGFGIATGVFPLTIFPCRLAVEHMFFGIRRQFSSLEFGVVTCILVGGAFGVAIATSNVDLVFGLVGSVAFSLTSFVFPGAVYLKSVGFDRTFKGVYLAVSSIILILFGVTSLVLGVIGWVQSL